VNPRITRIRGLETSPDSSMSLRDRCVSGLGDSGKRMCHGNGIPAGGPVRTPIRPIACEHTEARCSALLGGHDAKRWSFGPAAAVADDGSPTRSRQVAGQIRVVVRADRPPPACGTRWPRDSWWRDRSSWCSTRSIETAACRIILPVRRQRRPGGESQQAIETSAGEEESVFCGHEQATGNKGPTRRDIGC